MLGNKLENSRTKMPKLLSGNKRVNKQLFKKGGELLVPGRLTRKIILCKIPFFLK